MSLSPNLGIPEVDASQNQKEVTINNAIAALDNAGNATFTVVFTANARVLTATEYTNAMRFVCGSLTGPGTLTVPLTSRLFLVDNVTSGWPVTVKGATGAAVALPAGVIGILMCDGSHVILQAGTAGFPTPRNKGELQAQWVLGSVVGNGTFYFSYKAPYAGTITSLDSVSGSGTFTIDVEIAGVPVTGISAVAVTATPTNTVATGLYTFAAGAAITGLITLATGSPTNAVLNLNVAWS